jgi:hypothetical protein
VGDFHHTEEKYRDLFSTKPLYEDITPTKSAKRDDTRLCVYLKQDSEAVIASEHDIEGDSDD